MPGDQDQPWCGNARHRPPAVPAPAAADLGYDREAIGFLGLSRLHGVGFKVLSKLGGRAGVASLLDGRDADGL